jgi:hypothetical protein
VTEAQLERWLSAKLKLRSLPPGLWTHLKDENWVYTALEPDPGGEAEGLEEFVRAARRAQRLIRRSQGKRTIPGRPKIVAMRPLLRDGEVARARAFSGYLSRLAGDEPGVIRFRKAYLGGTTIGHRDAMQLLNSPAARFWRAEKFSLVGVPVVGHESELISGRQSRPGEDRLRIDVDLTVRWAGQSLDDADWIGVPAYWLRGTTFERLMPYFKEMRERTDVGAGNSRFFTAFPWSWPGSIIAELGDVADKMVDEDRGHYPWRRRDAMLFVLTGRTPVVQPLAVRSVDGSGERHTHVRIHLEVEPWVSAKSVLATFRRAQQQIFHRGCRPLSMRNLAVFEFVTRHLRAERVLPTWRVLVRTWNLAHPKWKYDPYDPRRFARDYRRTGRLIMGPTYSMSGLYAPEGATAVLADLMGATDDVLTERPKR